MPMLIADSMSTAHGHGTAAVQMPTTDAISASELSVAITC